MTEAQRFLAIATQHLRTAVGMLDATSAAMGSDSIDLFEDHEYDQVNDTRIVLVHELQGLQALIDKTR